MDLPPGAEYVAAPGEVIQGYSPISVVETPAGQLTIKVPTFTWEAGHARQNLDVRLTTSQAMTLKAIQLGLEQQEAQLVCGRVVSNPIDAIRWMLENAK